MDIKIVKIDPDGYNLAKIKDDENYLQYMYYPNDLKWKAFRGIINDTKLRQDLIGVGWMKNGKGRLSAATKQKIQNMNEYFFENIEV